MTPLTWGRATSESGAVWLQVHRCAAGRVGSKAASQPTADNGDAVKIAVTWACVATEAGAVGQEVGPAARQPALLPLTNGMR